MESKDPIFQEETRCAMFPIKYHSIWELLKKQRGCYWQTHEVSLLNDLPHWKALNKDEKYFIKMILAFFAASDLIVNKNLSERFTQELKLNEFQAIYHFQEMMEDIHSEMYSLLIDTYIDNPDEKEHLFNAVKEVPTVKAKAEWAYKWISSDRPFSHRLVAMAAIEGIFFSGAFCAIFWLNERGLLPGLSLSNKFISRDEGLHVDTAVEIHKLLKEKIEVSVMHEIISEAVALSIDFIVKAIPCKLIGMNAEMMVEYVKFVANRLIKSFGYPELYPKAKQPFTFMDRIGLDNKSNFFEQRSSEYNKLATNEPTTDPYADL